MLLDSFFFFFENQLEWKNFVSGKCQGYKQSHHRVDRSYYNSAKCKLSNMHYLKNQSSLNFLGK